MDRQERLCREVAERLGLVIVSGAVFVDNNRSAWQRNRLRPGWNALLEAIRAGHVIVYHPDRLMRQPRDLEEFLTLSEEHDITLHGQANRRDLSDVDDRFFLRIEVAHACRSSDDTSRRLRDALEDRARDGRPHSSGQRPYGYAGDAVTIIEHEAVIVREVYAWYLEGASPGLIARELDERGEVTVSGKPWQPYAVRSVLASRHVTGIRVFRGQEVGEGTGRRSSTGAPGPRSRSGGRTGLRRMTGGGGGFICCGGWWCAGNAAGVWPGPRVRAPRICAPGIPISVRSGAPAGSVPPGWRNSCVTRLWTC